MLLKPKKKGLILPSTAPFYKTAGGGGPTLLYVNTYAPSFTIGNPTATATGVSTGPAGLVVVIAYNVDNIATISSASIQGVACSGATGGIIGGVSSGNTGTAIIYANVSGTSGNIVITYGSNLTFGGLAFSVYSITGLTSIAPTGTVTQLSFASSPLSGSITTSSGGVVIAGAQQYASGNNTVISISTGTQTTDNSNFNPAGGFQTATDASSVGTGSGSNTVGATFTGVGDCTLVAGAWR